VSSDRGRQGGARPGDADGWARLSADVQAYERSRAGASATARTVRREDVVVLDRLLADLLRG
jgi:hypothetical protein